MNGEKSFNLTRIGVFYDGNYFLHVSNYYNYVHERQTRLSVAGLHDFIRHKVAQEEGTDYRLSQIVDAHYFRGRLNAKDASQKENSFYYDRVFDDILMSEGVTTHYLPVKPNFKGGKQEKGIDVWLALEAFELAFYKRFSVLVLIASDGDYVPLIRKLNTLGTRVMVLSWDFEYQDQLGNNCVTRTSQDLLEEVTYPIAMHEIIDNRVNKSSAQINNLFVPKSEKSDKIKLKTNTTQIKTIKSTVNGENEFQEGEIHSIKQGYGFIKYPPNNLFFHYQSVIEIDFNELEPGDKVQFKIVKNDRGENVATEVKYIE
jgi:uncharacterized LabA/DUF88 family protein/cold shock CspA family protein